MLFRNTNFYFYNYFYTIFFLLCTNFVNPLSILKIDSITMLNYADYFF